MPNHCGRVDHISYSGGLSELYVMTPSPPVMWLHPAWSLCAHVEVQGFLMCTDSHGVSTNGEEQLGFQAK